MKNWLLSLFRSDWDYHYNGSEFVMRRWHKGAYEARPLTLDENSDLLGWQSVK